MPPGQGAPDWDDAYLYLQDARAQADVLFDEFFFDEVQLWVAATDPLNPYLPDRCAADPDGSCEPLGPVRK